MQINPTTGDILQTAVQGLRRAEAQAGQAARNIVERPLDVQDVERTFHDIAEVAFKANAQVVKVAQDMNDHLLDILV